MFLNNCKLAKGVDALSRPSLRSGLHAPTCPLITPLFVKSCTVLQISLGAVHKRRPKKILKN